MSTPLEASRPETTDVVPLAGRLLTGSTFFPAPIVLLTRVGKRSIITSCQKFANPVQPTGYPRRTHESSRSYRRHRSRSFRDFHGRLRHYSGRRKDVPGKTDLLRRASRGRVSPLATPGDPLWTPGFFLLNSFDVGYNQENSFTWLN